MPTRGRLPTSARHGRTFSPPASAGDRDTRAQDRRDPGSLKPPARGTPAQRPTSGSLPPQQGRGPGRTAPGPGPTARHGTARRSGRPGRGSPWRQQRRAGMAARCLPRAAPRAPLPAPPSCRAGGWVGGWRETRSGPCWIKPPAGCSLRPVGSVSARFI